jgi:hypothetical protein
VGVVRPQFRDGGLRQPGAGETLRACSAEAAAAAWLGRRAGGAPRAATFSGADAGRHAAQRGDGTAGGQSAEPGEPMDLKRLVMRGGRERTADEYAVRSPWQASIRPRHDTAAGQPPSAERAAPCPHPATAASAPHRRSLLRRTLPPPHLLPRPHSGPSPPRRAHAVAGSGRAAALAPRPTRPRCQ